MPSGEGAGSVTCGDYIALYETNRSGTIQIIWIAGPKPGRSFSTIAHAAAQACQIVEDPD